MILENKMINDVVRQNVLLGASKKKKKKAPKQDYSMSAKDYYKKYAKMYNDYYGFLDKYNKMKKELESSTKTRDGEIPGGNNMLLYVGVGAAAWWLFFRKKKRK